MKLSDEEVRVLEVLGEEIDPETGEGANQFNYWTPLLGSDFGPITQTTLRNLKRKGLVGSEGRGKWAQFWITKKGAEALGAERGKKDEGNTDTPK